MPAAATKKRARKVRPEPTLEERIAKHLRARELGKKHYGRADRLLDELIVEMKVGEAVPLPGEKKATLVDLYAEKTKVFRAHGIGRFEIEVKDAG